MSVPEAMQTVFRGDGPTTELVVTRAAAEADLGRPFASAEEFAGWIDANNDRLYESALAKRETAHLFEAVTLEAGELLPPLPPEVPEDALVSAEPDEEARVLAQGEPVDGDPLFVGPAAEAFDWVLAHPPAFRAELILWTQGRVYGPAEFDAMLAARDRA